MSTQTEQTDQTGQADRADLARRTGGRRVATHAAFAMLVAATFAIFLALSLPLTRLTTQLHLFGSHGWLAPAGGSWSGILGIPNAPPAAIPPFQAPGVNGQLSPAIAPGPVDVAPPALSGPPVPPPVSGGGTGTGSGAPPPPKPPWWANLTPSQRLAAERRMAHRHWNHVHADRHHDNHDPHNHGHRHRHH